MLLISVFLLLSVAVQVKCDQASDVKWRDVQHNVIRIPITEYCKSRTCIVKCCPDGHIMSIKKGLGVTCIELRVNYTDFNKYIQDDVWREVKFIQNDYLSNRNNTVLFADPGIYILKDGSLKSPRYKRKSLEYCVDFYIGGVYSSPVLAVKLIRKSYDHYSTSKDIYYAAALMISCNLMMLLPLANDVFPRLRHFLGMVFTTFVMSLILSFAIKLITYVFTVINVTLRDTANIILNYLILSSLCWLNITPFELWFNTRHRGPRVYMDVPQRPMETYERVCMIVSCAFSWGIPLVVTLLTVFSNNTQIN